MPLSTASTWAVFRILACTIFSTTCRRAQTRWDEENVLYLHAERYDWCGFGQSRMTVNAKSPLTGAIGDSQAGGFFPAEMKFAALTALLSMENPRNQSTCGFTTASMNCAMPATCGDWAMGDGNTRARGVG